MQREEAAVHVAHRLARRAEAGDDELRRAATTRRHRERVELGDGLERGPGVVVEAVGRRGTRAEQRTAQHSCENRHPHTHGVACTRKTDTSVDQKGIEGLAFGRLTKN